VSESSAPLSKSARNERIKLRATLLNNLAVAFILASVLQPALAIVREGVQLRPLDGLASLLFGLLGYIFHRAGRDLLRGLHD
jgi:hypothetical protein